MDSGHYLFRKKTEIFMALITPLRIEFIKSICSKLEINNINFSTNSLDNLDYPNNFFDAIFSYQVLHLTPWKSTLRKFYRLLKPGGKVYVNFNDIGWYVYLWETEHNKAENYDPKSIAAQSFTQTLRYEINEKNFIEGDHFMISSQSMNNFLTDIGFNKISFGLEGSISFKDNPINDQPLSINKYKGLNCINEVVAFK